MKNLKTLVESQFPHISRGLGRGGDKKSAFTLAEVLITLGVIGVVAAMTLPTLIHNYQKTVYVNQLKKSYSIWEQAFQKILADDGVQKLSDTSVWASKGNASCLHAGGDSYTTDNCKAFVSSLNKYIKIIGVEKYGNKIAPLKGNYTTNTTDYYSLVLSDGSMVMLYASASPTSKGSEYCNRIKPLGGNMCSDAGSMDIDINGRKGPNIYGRDVFRFSYSDEGKLYPNGGKDYALYRSQQALNNNYSYWRNQSSSCGNADGTMPNSVDGDGCAARIMEEGWKMNY